MSLREWLTVIGIVVIIGVIVDGYRRMRQHRKREVELDFSIEKLKDHGDADHFFGELPSGGARISKKNQSHTVLKDSNSFNLKSGRKKSVNENAQMTDGHLKSDCEWKASVIPDCNLRAFGDFKENPIQDNNVGEDQESSKSQIIVDLDKDVSVCNTLDSTMSIKADKYLNTCEELELKMAVKPDKHLNSHDVLVDSQMVVENRHRSTQNDLSSRILLNPNERLNERSRVANHSNPRPVIKMNGNLKVANTNVKNTNDRVRVASLKDRMRINRHQNTAKKSKKQPYISTEQRSKDMQTNRLENIKENQTIKEVDDVIVINIQSKTDEFFRSDILLECFLAVGLRFGDRSIFHKYEGENSTGKIQFSLANGEKPGVFDINNIIETKTRILSVFLCLPCLSGAVQAFSEMQQMSLKLAYHLNGVLKDQNMSSMTEQTFQHCLQRIMDYEHEQMTNGMLSR